MQLAVPRRRTVLPGLGLTLGFALTYLSLVVLIPLAALVVRALGIPFSELVATIATGRVARALLLSFGAAAVAATINLVIGPVVAWVLVRYRFPGRRFLDAVVDLPFALPTAVAGIALASLFDGSRHAPAPIAEGEPVAEAQPGPVRGEQQPLNRVLTQDLLRGIFRCIHRQNRRVKVDVLSHEMDQCLIPSEPAA